MGRPLFFGKTGEPRRKQAFTIIPEKSGAQPEKQEGDCMAQSGMNEQEFKAYLEGLTGISPLEISVALYSSPSPFVVYRRLFQMRLKALSLDIPEDAFEQMVLELVIQGEEGERKRAKSDFSPFSPFIPFSPGEKMKKNRGLPAFPSDCLPPALRDFAQATAENLQVPVDMTAAAALAVAAVCVQGKFEVKVKSGWDEPLSLYLVETANPSERKSPVMKAMTAPLYRFTDRYNREHEGDIREYRTRHSILQSAVNRLTDLAAKGKADMEEVLDKERELMELEKSPVKPLRLLADDATPEALTSLLAENGGRMAVISSEGGLFDMAAGQYSDHVNIDILLKAFTGDPVMIDRKGRPSEQIDRPCLTMLLTVQPSVLQAVMENDTFRGRGFLARILYTLPPSLVGERRFETQPVPPLVREGYEVLLDALLSIPVPAQPGKICLSRAAYEEARAFGERLEGQLPEELEELQDWAGKYHGQVMRIAGILHCCRYDESAGSLPMELETMEAAEQIGEYFLAHAKAAFRMMGLMDTRAEKDARYLLKHLKTVKGDRLNKGELVRMCDGKFSRAEDMEPGLRELEKRGYVALETVRTGGRGRPATMVHLNPEYFQNPSGN